jgi:hypothetical protein
MRPVLRLLGKCELTIDGSPVPFEITRKVWHVVGLVATAPRCHIGRSELMEAAWPTSEKSSRSVLIFKWRRSIIDALEPYIPDTVVLITEQDVSLNTDYIDIDYQQCCSFARLALTSDDALEVLEAGTAFDTIAEDRVLLPSFSSAFLGLREQFDKQRMAVLRRAWQAEAYLHPESQAVKSNFEIRLRKLGDENAIGEPDLPFKALPEQSTDRMQKGILRTGFPRLAAAAVIGGMIAIPIIFGSISTPTKQQLRVAHGANVNNPMASLSNQLMYQLSDARTKRSAATAICVTPKNLVIVAGNAILTNGDHQNLLVMLTKTGQSRWITRLTDVKGIRTTPKQLLSTESGRIYVASVLSVERNNAQKLAPGSYLAVSVFDRDGQRLFERVHSEAINGNALLPIRLTSDHRGGIHAFAVSARGQASITMHIPAGRSTEVAAPLTGYPKAFQITDAISDDKGHVFLIGHMPVKTSAGTRLDWHIQAFDKASKTLWARDITGAVGTESAPVRGVMNAQGDVIVYGPLPSPTKGFVGRKVATMVTLSSVSGAVNFRECLDTELQNPNFALHPFTVGKLAGIAVTQQTPTGDTPLSIHRFGYAAMDTALTLTVRFLGNRRLENIISFYINDNGLATALMQPSKDKSSNSALTYMTMFFGRGIETGDLSATVPFGYNTRGGGLIAGHYDNVFCVYDFSKLP